jgi:hypothetical protein
MDDRMNPITPLTHSFHRRFSLAAQVNGLLQLSLPVKIIDFIGINPQMTQIGQMKARTGEKMREISAICG